MMVVDITFELFHICCPYTLIAVGNTADFRVLPIVANSYEHIWICVAIRKHTIYNTYVLLVQTTDWLADWMAALNGLWLVLYLVIVINKLIIWRKIVFCYHPLSPSLSFFACNSHFCFANTLTHTHSVPEVASNLKTQRSSRSPPFSIIPIQFTAFFLKPLRKGSHGLEATFHLYDPVWNEI